ncbi:MAG: metallophosphoesterase [Candidatus Cloacimonetes bacterium]|nr:metallophosphoesterase [Candidatus Cloacimonadota bacterium]
MNSKLVKLKLTCLSFLILLCGFLFADIAFYGDTQTDEASHRKIVAAIAAHKPKIAFHSGDLNSRGTAQSEYDLFFEISKPLTDICHVYPARGNHERSTKLFLDNFPFMGASTYYCKVFDGIRFIVLDSTMDLTPSSAQYKWLQTALQDTLPGIVILHYPIFSSGYHGDEHNLQLYLPQLLKRSNVKAVFSGHDHDYERSEYDGITYIVTGGGGGTIRQERNPNPHSVVFKLTHHYIIAKHVDGKLSLNAWDIDNKLIDSFVLTGF